MKTNPIRLLSAAILGLVALVLAIIVSIPLKLTRVLLTCVHVVALALPYMVFTLAAYILGGMPFVKYLAKRIMTALRERRKFKMDQSNTIITELKAFMDCRKAEALINSRADTNGTEDNKPTA